MLILKVNLKNNYKDNEVVDELILEELEKSFTQNEEMLFKHLFADRRGMDPAITLFCPDRNNQV